MYYYLDFIPHVSTPYLPDHALKRDYSINSAWTLCADHALPCIVVSLSERISGQYFRDNQNHLHALGSLSYPISIYVASLSLTTCFSGSIWCKPSRIQNLTFKEELVLGRILFSSQLHYTGPSCFNYGSSRRLWSAEPFWRVDAQNFSVLGLHWKTSCKGYGIRPYRAWRERYESFPQYSSLSKISTFYFGGIGGGHHRMVDQFNNFTGNETSVVRFGH